MRLTAHASHSIEDLTTRTEVPGRFPDGSGMDSAAVYFSGEWINTDRFDLNAGLRYSWFDITSAGQ